MEISAKTIAKTSGAYDGICTMQLCYPRFIHSQLMTHRMWARNARSSRAVPTQQLIDEVIDSPVVPTMFGKNCKGMAAQEPMADQCGAVHDWLEARDHAVTYAKSLAVKGAHKQLVNRILEPFLWIHSVVTFSETALTPYGFSGVQMEPFEHFVHLRITKHAQPEICALAMRMVEAYNSAEIAEADHHLPYITGTEFGETAERLKKASAMRCARVSYKPPDSAEPDFDRDVFRCEELIANGHHSPLEHPATQAHGSWGCYTGWRSFRAELGE